MPSPLVGPLLGFASRLRFPTLFKVTLGLFLINLFVPDLLPFIDELLLGLGTLTLGAWKGKSQAPVDDGSTTPQAPSSRQGQVIDGESRTVD